MSIKQAKYLMSVAALAAFSTACTRAATTPRADAAPSRDSRVGLAAGKADAAKAVWNLKVLSETPSPAQFADDVNSDIAFTGKYAIQGNFSGFQVWDISNPSRPDLVTAYYCPASQSDVSVYRNLLFVSGEGMEGRLDCKGGGVQGQSSKDRLRGIRIFDITDIRNPKYIANVQTCRGSHTHTVLEDPKDRENIYIYVSGSAPVRSADELPGCVNESPDRNPNSSLFRIEVIKVPLSDPTKSAIVSQPRIFENLTAPPVHGVSPADVEEGKKLIEAARSRGQFVAMYEGNALPIPPQFATRLLDSLVKERNGTGAPTAADSAKLRATIDDFVARMISAQSGGGAAANAGPNQCHDITVYPAIGLAGGACEGYGLLLDIKDPANPKRVAAVADSNFAYWHSATFNNDGTKVLFTDEWGGGSSAKCRAGDKAEWGANAIFAVNNNSLEFQSYYKLPAPQTAEENCVAHNGSLIPIPGRDVMVQSWYQGGISIFDWTDGRKPVEIAYFDRGPIDSTRLVMGGSWSVYWYNGAIVSSEIARGLDIVELVPSQFISQNEIDAANTVRYEYLNPQGQPKMVWPPSFALARSFVDQLERNKCMSSSRIASVRTALSAAERASGADRGRTLQQLASQIDADAASSCDTPRMQKLSAAVKDLSVTM